MSWYILVADASKGVLYSTDGKDKPLRLVQQLDNPRGRARTQELVTDEPGRVFNSDKPGTRSAMEPRTTAHEAAVERFAAELATALHKARTNGEYDSLAIVAPAHLLGQLRTRLAKDVENVLQGTLARDLVKVPAHELASHIAPLFEQHVKA